MPQEDVVLENSEDRTKIVVVKTMLERSKDEVSRALSGQMDPERFLRVALTTYQTGEGLTETDPITFIGCIVQAAQLGLSTDPLLGECYLLPRWNKHLKRKVCTLQIGYQGLMKRCRRSPLLDNIDADVVHANDEFEVIKGVPDSIIRHKPCLRGDPGPIVASYAIARFKTGSYVFRVCMVWEIEKARLRSDAGKKGWGPWKTDYDAMAMKTAIRRLTKVLPTDDVTRAQITNEERDESVIDAAFAERIIQAGPPRSDNPPQQSVPATTDDLATQHENERRDEDVPPPTDPPNEDRSEDPT